MKLHAGPGGETAGGATGRENFESKTCCDIISTFPPPASMTNSSVDNADSSKSKGCEFEPPWCLFFFFLILPCLFLVSSCSIKVS